MRGETGVVRGAIGAGGRMMCWLTVILCMRSEALPL